jgi:hypothetical protein
MIKKRRYWHGLILGLAAGISFGFLFSSWIDRGTNSLVYVSAFVVCALVSVFLGAAIESLPETPRFNRPIKRARDAYCSFCRKAHKDTGPLVEGPSLELICGACVDLSRRLIDQEITRRAATSTPETGRDPVERLEEKEKSN